MQREALKSRSVKSVGYDPESRELEVEFATGRVYSYSDVPGSVHAWLLRTTNKGSFVTRMIAPVYAYRLVSDGRPPRGTAPGDLLGALLASLSR
jgi:hypothetical protein